jgi:hypothetical protein
MCYDIAIKRPSKSKFNANHVSPVMQKMLGRATAHPTWPTTRILTHIVPDESLYVFHSFIHSFHYCPPHS